MLRIYPPQQRRKVPRTWMVGAAEEGVERKEEPLLTLFREYWVKEEPGKEVLAGRRQSTKAGGILGEETTWLVHFRGSE